MQHSKKKTRLFSLELLYLCPLLSVVLFIPNVRSRPFENDISTKQLQRGVENCRPSVFLTFDDTNESIPWPFITLGDAARIESTSQRSPSTRSTASRISSKIHTFNSSLVSLNTSRLTMSASAPSPSQERIAAAVELDHSIVTGDIGFILDMWDDSASIVTLWISAENHTISATISASNRSVCIISDSSQGADPKVHLLRNPLHENQDVSILLMSDSISFAWSSDDAYVAPRPTSTQNMPYTFFITVEDQSSYNPENGDLVASPRIIVQIDDFFVIETKDDLCQTTLGSCGPSFKDHLDCALTSKHQLDTIFVEPFYKNVWSDSRVQFVDDQPMRLNIKHEGGIFLTGKYEWVMRHSTSRYSVDILPAIGSGAVTSFGVYYSADGTKVEYSINIVGTTDSPIYLHMIENESGPVNIRTISVDIPNIYSKRVLLEIEYTPKEVVFWAGRKLIGALPVAEDFSNTVKELSAFVSVRVAESSESDWAGEASSYLHEKFVEVHSMSHTSDKCDGSGRTPECFPSLLDLGRLIIFLCLSTAILLLFSFPYIRYYLQRRFPNHPFWAWLESFENSGETNQSEQDPSDRFFAEDSDPEDDIHTILNMLLGGEQRMRPRTGLPQLTIEMLPVSNWNPERHKLNDACCICLTDFSEGESVRQLPCNHVFHPECVDPWLARKTDCPMCKYVVPQFLFGDHAHLQHQSPVYTDTQQEQRHDGSSSPSSNPQRSSNSAILHSEAGPSHDDPH